MCIAILNQASVIDAETFENCWSNNPDGGGIAYIDNHQVKILKEMDSVELLYEQYVAIRKWNELPMILHFRIGTSGLVDEANCHPFEVCPGVVMAHNGILENVEATQTVNDTRVFIEEILQSLPEGFLYNEGIRRLMGGFVGQSKLVFLSSYGNYDIINEDLGHWDAYHLNWFSNYSYMDSSYYQPVRNWRRRHKEANQEEQMELESNWSECPGCGNWVDASELEFDQGFREWLCRDCLDMYYEDMEALRFHK